MRPGAHRVGPFLVSLDDHDAGLSRNYAVPDDGADPSREEVGKLVAFFVGHSRIPRLEYLPALCPAVEQVLFTQGFVPERRLPVMTCPPTDMALPSPEGIDLELAFTDDQLRQVARPRTTASANSPRSGSAPPTGDAGSRPR